MNFFYFNTLFNTNSPEEKKRIYATASVYDSEITRSTAN